MISMGTTAQISMSMRKRSKYALGTDSDFQYSVPNVFGKISLNKSTPIVKSADAAAMAYCPS